MQLEVVMTNTENLYERIAEQEWLGYYGNGMFCPLDGPKRYISIDSMVVRLIEKHNLIITPYIKVEGGKRVKYYKVANWLSHQAAEDQKLEQAVFMAALEIGK